MIPHIIPFNLKLYIKLVMVNPNIKLLIPKINIIIGIPIIDIPIIHTNILIIRLLERLLYNVLILLCLLFFIVSIKLFRFVSINCLFSSLKKAINRHPNIKAINNIIMSIYSVLLRLNLFIIFFIIIISSPINYTYWMYF